MAKERMNADRRQFSLAPGRSAPDPLPEAYEDDDDDREIEPPRGVMHGINSRRSIVGAAPAGARRGARAAGSNRGRGRGRGSSSSRSTTWAPASLGDRKRERASEGKGPRIDRQPEPDRDRDPDDDDDGDGSPGDSADDLNFGPHDSYRRDAAAFRNSERARTVSFHAYLEAKVESVGVSFAQWWANSSKVRGPRFLKEGTYLMQMLDAVYDNNVGRACEVAARRIAALQMLDQGLPYEVADQLDLDGAATDQFLPLELRDALFKRAKTAIALAEKSTGSRASDRSSAGGAGIGTASRNGRRRGRGGRGVSAANNSSSSSTSSSSSGFASRPAPSKLVGRGALKQ